MAQFDQLLQTGHKSIAGMIEKCASTAFMLYNEMDDDANDGDDDDSVAQNSNESDIDIDETDSEDDFDHILGMPGLLDGSTMV
jgi:hypothetical protein